MQTTTTLKDIRDADPCENGWKTLLNGLGKTATQAKHDETALPVMRVLEINGLVDALWVLDNCCDPYVCRLFAADCAEQVLPIFERERPGDSRPRDAITVVRSREATDDERAAARAAAMAATRAATGAAERTAAGAALWAAAWAAAGAALWASLWAAERTAARAAQTNRLKQYLEFGEAAKDMPWPEGVE